jgi:hypothetical protein
MLYAFGACHYCITNCEAVLTHRDA